MHRLQTSAKWISRTKQFDQINTPHFVIQSLNTSSLKAHRLDIEADPSLMASDILCLQETKITISDNMHVSGFDVINTYGPHGVAIHYKPHIRLIKHTTSTTPNIEISYAHFIHPIIRNIHILTIYKSPSAHPATLFQELQVILQQIIQDTCNLAPIILLGDFNITATTTNNNHKKLAEVLSIAHLKQQINHVTTIYGSIIDHIWINNFFHNTMFGTNHCYWSDHAILYMQLLIE